MTLHTYPFCKPTPTALPTDLFRAHLMDQGFRLSDTFCLFTKARANGRQSRLNFWHVYSLYLVERFPGANKDAIAEKIGPEINFLRPLFGVRIQDFSKALIKEFLIFQKTRENQLQDGPDRPAHEKFMNNLHSILQWHIEKHDLSFANPVDRR